MHATNARMADPRELPLSAWSDRDAVLAFVQDRDAACPLCGYNLRNLSEPRCPECGHELRMTLGLAKPFLAAWIATFVGCAPAAGLGVLALAVSLDGGPPRWGRDPNIFLAYWWCVAMVPVTGLLIWQRPRFVQMRRNTQVALGTASVLAALLMLILILAEIF